MIQFISYNLKLNFPRFMKMRDSLARLASSIYKRFHIQNSISILTCAGKRNGMINQGHVCIKCIILRPLFHFMHVSVEKMPIKVVHVNNTFINYH